MMFATHDPSQFLRFPIYGFAAVTVTRTAVQTVVNQVSRGSCTEHGAFVNRMVSLCKHEENGVSHDGKARCHRRKESVLEHIHVMKLTNRPGLPLLFAAWLTG